MYRERCDSEIALFEFAQLIHDSTDVPWPSLDFSQTIPQRRQRRRGQGRFCDPYPGILTCQTGLRLDLALVVELGAVRTTPAGQIVATSCANQQRHYDRHVFTYEAIVSGWLPLFSLHETIVPIEATPSYRWRRRRRGAFARRPVDCLTSRRLSDISICFAPYPCAMIQ